MKASKCSSKGSLATHGFPWDLPVALKNGKPLNQVDYKFLDGWKQISVNWAIDNLSGHIYQRKDKQAELLELDGYVQMQVLKNRQFETPTEIVKKCRQAMNKRTTSQGDVWTCGNWAILVQDKRIKEAWWNAHL